MVLAQSGGTAGTTAVTERLSSNLRGGAEPPKLGHMNAPRRLAGLVLALVAAAGAVPARDRGRPATGLKAEYFDAPDLTGTPGRDAHGPEARLRLGPVRAGAGRRRHVLRALEGHDHAALQRALRLSVQLRRRRAALHRRPDPHRRLRAARRRDAPRRRRPRRRPQARDRARVPRHRPPRLDRLEWRSPSQAREVVPSERLAPPADAPPCRSATPRPTPARSRRARPPRRPRAAAARGRDARRAGRRPATPSPLPPPAPPIAGETFNAEPAKGEVMVRRPGDDELDPARGGRLAARRHACRHA